ncbi:hypothetical protein ABE218_00320 [Bacillus smithii]|uniref:hypothetical protein n=1 Tax=Bacillus smithii TaxID=1479 RepID=UPI003D24846B
MKEKLNQILTELQAIKKEIREYQDEVIQSLKRQELKTHILEDLLKNIELGKLKDTLINLNSIKKNMESRTEVLNRRLFNIEAEIERMKRT